MQKLRRRIIKNTPTNISLIRSNCGSLLNKEETLSVMDLKTCLNNPEENLRLPVGGLKDNTLVYVLNKDGSPLMPCKPAKARHLLKNGRARVVKRSSFTIQLNWECENQVQPITLGLDTGYEKVGISARTDKKELVRVEVGLRTDVSKKLEERKMYRRGRRNKLWYREPRFLNRGKKGWLAPSVQHKLDSHARLINMICKYLPVSKINVEMTNFNIQKIKNPDIEGIEYQRGDLYNYENMKSYLIVREHNKCQLCGKESSKGNPFRIHHIIEKNNGGTDSANNLALLHEKCHIKFHKKGLKLKLNKQYKAESFMNIVKHKLVEKLKKILPTNVTYGYITKVERNKLGLSKSHSNDAFVISGGTNQERCKELLLTQKRKNNRCLQLNRKGFKPSIRRCRYKIQPKDLVWIDNKEFMVKGMSTYGKRVCVVDSKNNILNYAINKVDKHFMSGGLVKAIHPKAKALGFLA